MAVAMAMAMAMAMAVAAAVPEAVAVIGAGGLLGLAPWGDRCTIDRSAFSRRYDVPQHQDPEGKPDS